MAPSASKKGSDTDFQSTLCCLTTSRGCGCGCGHREERTFSPLPVTPFGAEPVALSEEALARRGEVIKALLPKLRVLVTELTAFNTRGGIGPGEVELLGDLQHWLLQLQVEEDCLRLTPPAGDPR